MHRHGFGLPCSDAWKLNTQMASRQRLFSLCSASRLSYLVGAASQAAACSQAPRQTSRRPIVFFAAWEEQGPRQDPKEWHFDFLTTPQSVSRTVFHPYRLTLISWRMGVEHVRTAPYYPLNSQRSFRSQNQTTKLATLYTVKTL